MPKIYSQDLRIRVIKAHEEGQTRQQIADRFKIGISTVGRYIRIYRETGSVKNKKSTVFRKTILQEYSEIIIKWINDCSHITLHQIKDRLLSEKSVKVSIGTIFNFLKRIDMPYKKKQFTQQNKKEKTY